MKSINAPKTKRCLNKVIRIKIISMGASGVGKSCLIKRYCEGKFVTKYIATIGVDYGVKQVDYGDYQVRVNLWDLAGGNEYLEVRNECYRDAQGGLLTYDATSRGSFETLEGWIEESAKYGAGDMVIIVVATKSDMLPQAVSEEEGRSWAKKKGLLFFQVSAATGHHVVPMFATLFARVMATVCQIPNEVVSEAVQNAAHFRSIEGAII